VPERLLIVVRRVAMLPPVRDTARRRMIAPDSRHYSQRGAVCQLCFLESACERSSRFEYQRLAAPDSRSACGETRATCARHADWRHRLARWVATAASPIAV